MVVRDLGPALVPWNLSVTSESAPFPQPTCCLCHCGNPLSGTALGSPHSLSLQPRYTASKTHFFLLPPSGLAQLWPFQVPDWASLYSASPYISPVPVVFFSLVTCICLRVALGSLLSVIIMSCALCENRGNLLTETPRPLPRTSSNPHGHLLK